MRIFRRWILNVWRCCGLYLALHVTLENLILTTLKAYKALVQGKNFKTLYILSVANICGEKRTVQYSQQHKPLHHMYCRRYY